MSRSALRRFRRHVKQPPRGRDSRFIILICIAWYQVEAVTRWSALDSLKTELLPPGRYTHRVAISNSRLVSMEQGRVSFTWKDYRDGNQEKLMTLDADEFIRRFLVHVLADGFMRIRHTGC